MPEIVARGKGGVRVRLSRDEAELMRELSREMRTLLEADIPRVDPVIARLFPDAYEEEADASAYRELVGDDLRTTKLDALRTVEDKLGRRGSVEASFDAAETDAWLSLLTDMRLAIGTRLGVTQETMDSELDLEGPEAATYSVLHYVGWLQEMTVEELMEEEA